MTNLLQPDLSQPIVGLATWTYVVTSATAGEITVRVKSTIPLGSGLQIVINLNGSPQVTVGGAATNPTPTQQSLGASATLGCAAADTITVVFSSSNAVDALPNAVKSIVNLYHGQ